MCPHAGDGGVTPTYNSFLPAVQKRSCLFCFILVLAKGAFFSHGFLLLLAKSRDSFFSWLEEKKENRMMYFDGPGRKKRRDLMTLVPKSSSISLPSFPLSPSTYIFLFSEQRRRRLRSSKSPARLIRKYLLEERCTRRNSSCF